MADNRRPRFLRLPRVRRAADATPDAAHPREATAGKGRRGRERDSEAGAERERIVIPRQERGAAPPSGLDIDLREVRYGAASKTAYLRVVPRQRQFRRVGTGHIEATPLASRPRGSVARMLAGARSLALGSPLAASQAIHERLTKVKALAVLGSDPLSSSAYATEEALIILALAGSAAFVYSLPIAAAVAALMIIVVVSYSQTQKAYPSGGGAYIVAHENLGRMPGLVAGAALIVDYVLLVSVSAAAGVAAITSAVPELLDWRVPLSAAIIGVFTLGNLRGIRESGTLFAAPVYYFILAMGGVVRWVSSRSCSGMPQARFCTQRRPGKK